MIPQGDTTCLWVERLNIIRLLSVAKLIYKFQYNVFKIKRTTEFFSLRLKILFLNPYDKISEQDLLNNFLN